MQKVYNAQVKALDGDAEGTFEAIVSVFNNVDRQGDRVMPGAFTKTLEKWRASGDRIPIVLAHQSKDPWAYIGSADPSEMVETEGFLKGKGTLDLKENPLARQVWRLMKQRLLKNFSFQWEPLPGGEKRAKDGAMDLTSIDLYEWGPCLVGANGATDLLAIKSALEDENPTLEDRVAALTVNVSELTESLRAKGLLEAPPDEPEEDEEPEAEEPERAKASEVDDIFLRVTRAQRVER